MRSLTVGLAERAYRIDIGRGALSGLPEQLCKLDFPSRVAVISNPTIAQHYLSDVLSGLTRSGLDVESFEVPDGEHHKSLKTLEQIFDFLIKENYDRNSGLIALGGGVVGDMVGFAAATYLRGVPFVQVPTTLLSQVDSSVGGKTAVNHPLGKNLIGAFYQPAYVCIDVDTLATLPEREYSSGLAEVIKYGVIRDREFFSWLQGHVKELVSRDSGVLIEAIARSCQIKANIVEIDERESSLRAILNYGHTIGHAVEKLAGYGEIKHGEAVAVGMVAAAKISHHLNICSMKDVDDIRDLLSACNLPVELPGFAIQDYLEIMYRDKKVQSGQLRMILNRGIGECDIHAVDHPEELFQTVFPELVTQ